MANFVNFRFHSPYSLGTVKLKEMAEMLKKSGSQYFPLFENGSLVSIYEHHKIAQQYGLKPITTTAISVALHYDSTQNHELCFVIANETGYSNMCHILTQAETTHKGAAAQIILDDFATLDTKTEKIQVNSERLKGLIALSGGKKGYLYKRFLQYKTDNQGKSSKEIAPCI